jgi:hypothetical protein
LDGLDVEAYQRALQLQNKYVPHFIKPWQWPFMYYRGLAL